MLAFTRQQVFRPELFDVTDALSDYYTLLRDIIDERIKLDIVHGRDLPRIRADKGQLETVVTNLCTNARDAMIDERMRVVASQFNPGRRFRAPRKNRPHFCANRTSRTRGQCLNAIC